MDNRSILSTVENLLNSEKLSFKRSKSKDFVFFEKIQVGEDCSIKVFTDFISIFVTLRLPNETKEMKNILYKFKWIYKGLNYISKNVENSKLFEITLYPFKMGIFIDLFKLLCDSFQREVSPFLLGIVKDDPEGFFLKQYNEWKSIPPEEQAQFFEHVLEVKETYFRGTKTLRGIISKLNRLKIEFAHIYESSHQSEQPNYDEFYLIDFAALFRAMELKLIKFTLDKFFEGFSLER